jgi:hypothetical protein
LNNKNAARERKATSKCTRAFPALVQRAKILD